MSGLVLLFVSAYMFDKLAKSVCRTVGNTPSAALQSLLIGEM